MARNGPNKLTPEAEARILAYLRRGLTLSKICERLNISEDALRKHKRKHREFYALMEQALLEQEAVLVERICSGGSGWQGAAWILARRYPAEYGRRVEEQLPPTPPVQITVVRLDEPDKTKPAALPYAPTALADAQNG